jgi:hypothetical protein
MPFEIFVIPGIALLILGFIRGIKSYKLEDDRLADPNDNNAGKVKF